MIAAGETITIPAGRVAVLPNVQVDGTLNISGEVFIPSGATTEDLDNRIALKADTTYVDTQLSNKANTADLKEIGVGQTWQDVTSSRVAGTTYTNTTGKPIEIIITGTNMSATAFYIAIDGVQRAMKQGSGNVGVQASLSIIVPNNSTYAVSVASSTITSWQELR